MYHTLKTKKSENTIGLSDNFYRHVKLLFCEEKGKIKVPSLSETHGKAQ
jgi:hypothetical protein